MASEWRIRPARDRAVRPMQALATAPRKSTRSNVARWRPFPRRSATNRPLAAGHSVAGPDARPQGRHGSEVPRGENQGRRPACPARAGRNFPAVPEHPRSLPRRFPASPAPPDRSGNDAHRQQVSHDMTGKLPAVPAEQRSGRFPMNRRQCRTGRRHCARSISDEQPATASAPLSRSTISSSSPVRSRPVQKLGSIDRRPRASVAIEKPRARSQPQLGGADFQRLDGTLHRGLAQPAIAAGPSPSRTMREKASTRNWPDASAPLPAGNYWCPDQVQHKQWRVCRVPGRRRKASQALQRPCRVWRGRNRIDRVASASTIAFAGDSPARINCAGVGACAATLGRPEPGRHRCHSRSGDGVGKPLPVAGAELRAIPTTPRIRLRCAGWVVQFRYSAPR